MCFWLKRKTNQKKNNQLGKALSSTLKHTKAHFSKAKHSKTTKQWATEPSLEEPLPEIVEGGAEDLLKPTAQEEDELFEKGFLAGGFLEGKYRVLLSFIVLLGFYIGFCWVVL